MGSSAVGDEDDAVEAGKLSNQYHGVSESNSSKYVILSVTPPASDSSGTAMQSTPSSKFATERISVRPIYGFHNFSQPYKFASLTMEEAENAIEQQRNVVTRYMMHGRLSSQAADKNEAAAAIASGVAVTGRGNRPMGPPPKAMSRARLLGKLAGEVSFSVTAFKCRPRLFRYKFLAKRMLSHSLEVYRMPRHYFTS